MKATVSIFLTALTAYTIGLFSLPWYSFAFTTFIIYFAIPQNSFKSFFSAFLTLAILSLLIAGKQDFDNEHLLSKKVAMIFKLKESYSVLYVLTCFLFGIIAGFTAITGIHFRRIFSNKKR